MSITFDPQYWFQFTNNSIALRLKEDDLDGGRCSNWSLRLTDAACPSCDQTDGTPGSLTCSELSVSECSSTSHCSLIMAGDQGGAYCIKLYTIKRHLLCNQLFKVVTPSTHKQDGLRLVMIQTSKCLFCKSPNTHTRCCHGYKRTHQLLSWGRHKLHTVL